MGDFTGHTINIRYKVQLRTPYREKKEIAGKNPSVLNSKLRLGKSGFSKK
jgi:hypothetical protein